MGVIQKQSLKGVIFSYLGIIVGFATSVLIFPRILSPGEIGLLKLLISYSTIFGIFAGFGFTNALARFFTYFRNSENKHNGIFGLTLAVNMAGLLLAWAGFELFKPYLIADSKEKSELFVQYIHYIVPLIFAQSLFNSFDVYSRVLHNASKPVFAKEFLWRIIAIVLAAIYYLGYISLSQFVLYYSISIGFPVFYLLIGFVINREISFSVNWEILDKPMVKAMAGVSLSAIITGYTTVLAMNIDSLMINSFLGIESTGIYVTVFFFGSLIMVPSRSVKKIAAAVVADALKEENFNQISQIYSKSINTLSIIGSFLFMGIWINVHNIFTLLPPEYAIGKWVIFFISISSLAEMFGGVNITIISLSKYYLYNAYLTVTLILLFIVTNYFFIPIWGISGAALASALSMFIFNILKWAVIKRFFNIQPYQLKHLFLLLFLFGLFLLNIQLPSMGHYIIDFFIRSSLFSVFFLFVVYKMNISEDINEKIDKTVSILRNSVRK